MSLIWQNIPMKKNNRQLHELLPDLVLFSHYSAGKVVTRDGTNLPHIVYPDNTPCMIANLYMLALSQRKTGRGGSLLSRRGSKGGTVGDYALKVGQLIRFCYLRKINFLDLNDDLFTDFIYELRKETSPKNSSQKKKDEPTITTTGRVCLDFLDYVGNFYGDTTFVSPEGTIRGEQKKQTIEGKNPIVKTYWHHHSFSTGGRKRKRKPISQTNIEKLYDAIYEMDSSRFTQHRREIQLQTLEHTGARRAEINQIKVSDIVAAAEMKEPMLKLVTLKREKDRIRFVPVHRMFINDMLKFIRISREKIIQSTIGKKNDHDYVFVGEHGKPLSDGTLSNEIYDIRTFAKIEEEVCNHMFRHAFCTNLFVLLIERHEIENEDRFRQQLLGEATFKAEVAQYTDHKNPESLTVYIRHAFNRISGFQKTVSSAEIIRVIELFDRKQLLLINKLEHGLLTIEKYKLELEQLKDARNKDMTVAADKAESQS